MTITEVSEKYKIPLALLQRYATEKTEAKGTDKKQRQADSYRFTDNDIEQLSVRMTLQDIGFAEEEIDAWNGLITCAMNFRHRRRGDKHGQKRIPESNRRRSDDPVPQRLRHQRGQRG